VDGIEKLDLVVISILDVEVEPPTTRLPLEHVHVSRASQFRTTCAHFLEIRVAELEVRRLPGRATSRSDQSLAACAEP
jgi:predicted DNA-binding protein with PD1-like motif